MLDQIGLLSIAKYFSKMKYYANSRPSHGVAFKPWAERVKELLDEHEVKFPSTSELAQYYHADLSYEEVLFKEQFKTFKNVWLELNVRHERGTFNTHFNTSEQARDFFKKFPELKKELER